MGQRWLKWLPESSDADMARLRALLREAPEIGQIEQLSALEWGPTGLRLLAKCAAAINASPNMSAEYSARGFVKLKALIFSNASALHLADPIIASGLRHRLLIETMMVEYEEPEAFLTRESAAVRAFSPDIVLINYDVSAFSLRAPLGAPHLAQQCADAAAERLASIRRAVQEQLARTVLLQTVTPDPGQSRLNMDRGLAGSHRDLVARLNDAVAELARTNGDLVLDTAAIAASVGLENWTSRKYWVTAKYPVAPDAVPLYADHFCKLAAVIAGKSRRVLVLDLDNTLWGGIVGDDGKENLALGGGSALGESHRDIQLMAKDLRQRGIVLCVSSKNEESVALDAFRTHPEMVLTEDDIAMFQINWSDKAANIKAMSESLSLGLNSFVFLDDNPAERSRVRNALPEVAVPELPKDVSEWVPVFQSACYFEALNYSEEDAARANYYKNNALRAQTLEKFADHDAYLASLKMEMEIKPFDAAGRVRIVQLIAKSNQFNLTTLRRSDGEVAALENKSGAVTFQVRLRDQFGDNGMISVIVGGICEGVLEIDTWLMSCRVLGRRVEEKILDALVESARAAGAGTITGSYFPTSKNAMVRNHYAGLGFDLIEEMPDGSTRWKLDVAGYRPKNPPIKTANLSAIAA
jgi:FkbH-like protein